MTVLQLNAEQVASLQALKLERDIARLSHALAKAFPDIPGRVGERYGQLIRHGLERAVAHASGGGNGKPIVEGVEMVLKGLLDVLGKHGVAQISAIGQVFDPAKHEAIAQIESDAHEPNSVVEELHKGYSLHDRLLRPALVSVAKRLKSQGKKNTGSQVENDPTDD